jgi:hypothetical protein
VSSPNSQSAHSGQNTINSMPSEYARQSSSAFSSSRVCRPHSAQTSSCSSADSELRPADVGLFYRKTKKMRGGYLTVSKRGPSVSLGPKGFKISSRGRVSLSKGGFRFTKKLF